jgi:RNA polymerase sigma factor (sigma-70 family)
VTEREIAEAIRQGRQVAAARDTGPLVQAYAQLHRLLRANFLRYLVYRVGQDAGEDLLQELTLLVIQAIEEDRIEDSNALLSFARGVARNLRSRAAETQSRLMGKVIPLPKRDKTAASGDGSSPEAELIDREQAAQMAGIFQSLLGELDPEHREIVLRFYFRGQPAAQIQRELKLTAMQLKARMQLARTKLQRGYRRLKLLSPPDELLPIAG